MFQSQSWELVRSEVTTKTRFSLEEFIASALRFRSRVHLSSLPHCRGEPPASFCAWASAVRDPRARGRPVPAGQGALSTPRHAGLFLPFRSSNDNLHYSSLFLFRNIRLSFPHVVAL